MLAIKRIGQFRGEQVQALYVYPLRHIAEGTAEYISSITVEVTFTADATGSASTAMAFEDEALYRAVKKELPRRPVSRVGLLSKTASSINTAQVKSSSIEMASTKSDTKTCWKPALNCRTNSVHGRYGCSAAMPMCRFMWKTTTMADSARVITLNFMASTAGLRARPALPMSI
ncbi:MAG: hypothetical protein Q9P14_03215 [candidate division KSB1 bacterium]|nr:hypothetical protein [candidate division KSB1 bacterium]